jgi:RNA polymerase sigma-70 factor (ECF subfamily)
VPTDHLDLASLADEEAELLASLRSGDDSAFAKLVDRYYGSMLRVARAYVATKEAAEDVVQEAWIGVLQGLDRFEGRSSLKTWLFRILIKKAITRGTRDARSVPFSSLGPDEPAVDPSRFRDRGRWVGFWAVPPSSSDAPERILVSKEARAKIGHVISTLPASQRLVITLRDVQGFTAAEACDLLDLTEANQRVLLHRARSKVRAALEAYLDDRVGAEP